MTTSNQTGVDTLTALKEILVRVAGTKLRAEDISDTADPFDDCGLDSVSMIDFVLAIEEKFGLILAEDRLDQNMFRNLSRLAAFIESETLVKK